MRLIDGGLAGTDRARIQSAAFVREGAQRALELAREGRLEGWRLDEDRLPAVVDAVVETTRARYPTLAIPFHARWRHFVADGRDLGAELLAGAAGSPTGVRLRAAFDLAILSVLLDAGAGMGWRYREPLTGITASKSEGLALASLALFRDGAFSGDPADPCRADAAVLARLDGATLAAGFQASEANPLVGLEGRVALLQRLGRHLLQVFPDGEARPGRLADHLLAAHPAGRVPAPAILQSVLALFGPIWPDRPGAVPGCGDAWWDAAGVPLAGGQRVLAFHKLSQWLSYSLIEPLEAAGVTVTDVDGLTGLPEYRNGGLFIDLGVLTPSDPADLTRRHEPGDALIIRWRALTVALLDVVAAGVRARLGCDAAAMPLAKVLEGGTWATGRRIARERRADGGPPLTIASDGTVF